MGRERGMQGAWLWALLAVAVAISPAFAEVTTERPGSILFFPKVIASGTRDTIIQISNVSNSMVHAHCFYVNAALEFPGEPPGLNNQPRWQEVDFDIWLTKQQPTHWVVSQGRRVYPLDPQCFPGVGECNDAGLDPGRVPPMPPDFVGELKCIEVDSSGAPISGNHLKGEATLVVTTKDTAPGGPLAQDPDDVGDASKYSALAVVGLDSNDANNILCLGGGVSGDCPNGAEYNACPQTTVLDTFASGPATPLQLSASNPQLPLDSFVSTELTIVPCEEDFENQSPATVVVQFKVTNEFEEPFSTSISVTCWGNLELNDINRIIFNPATAGSRLLQTRLQPATDADPGIVVIAEEFHHVPGLGTARAAYNAHTIGERSTADVITIPEGP